MNYLFRGEPDGFVFKVFSPIHIILIVALIALMVIMHKYKNKFNPKIFRVVTMIVLFTDRVIMFYWYYTSGVLSLKESLPLYTCRTAVYLLLIYFITKNKFIKNVAVHWSIFGGILAFIYPFLFAYKFPHYTNFSFFIYHMLLILLGYSIVVYDDYKFTYSGFKDVAIFTGIYLILVRFIVINNVPGSNYAYLRFSPIAKEALLKLNTYVYSGIIMVVTLLIFFLLFSIARFIQQKSAS